MIIQKHKGTLPSFFGIRSVKGGSIVTESGTLQFFLLQPISLTVLSKEALQERIRSMMLVMEQMDAWEWICMDRRETCTPNCQFFKERLAAETNPLVRNKLKHVLETMGEPSETMTAGRQFFLCIRKENAAWSDTDTASLLGALESQGFFIRPADEEDIYGMLSRYFGMEHEEGFHARTS